MNDVVTFIKLFSAIFTSLGTLFAALIKLSKTKPGGDFIAYLGNNFSSGTNSRLDNAECRLDKVEIRLDKGDIKMDKMIEDSKSGDKVIETKVDYVQHDVTIIKECLLKK